MNAIEKGFSLGEAEKNRVSTKSEQKNPEIDIQKNQKDKEANTTLSKAKKLLEELPLIKKKEFGLSFSRSPAGAILQGEVDPGKIINHPRAGAGFAAFVLKAVANCH
jgi:hypothetical protein